jgi:nicotinamidase-related amidase
MPLLSAERSVIVIVDIQERLAPAIDGLDRVVSSVVKLILGAQRLRIPIIVTEQYPEGLGATLTAVRSSIGTATTISKMSFDATAEPELRAALDRHGRPDIVVCGTESHVCVLQTAFGLASMEGCRPIIVEDACGSRRESDRRRAMMRMDRAGIDIVTTEMVLFEWMRRAGTDIFRDIIKVIK